MRKFILAVILVNLLGSAGNVFADNTKIILATGEWPPYTSQTIDGDGVFCEIATAAFKEVGIESVYTFYPWKRAEYTVESGKAFAVFPYIQTDARKKNFNFSDRVMVSTGRFFYLKTDFPNGINYTRFKDLAHYTISGVLGYWYEKPFKEANLNVEYVTSDEQSFKKLHAHRVELVASEELVGWALIRHLFPHDISQFATIDKPLNQDDLRLMISKKYPGSLELTEKFNSGLAAIRKKGILSRILAKHRVKD